MFILAAADTLGLPPWAQVLVALAALFSLITKQIVPGWLYNDRCKEVAELRQENARLVQLVFDTQKSTLPAMEAATSAIADAMAELRVRRRAPE